MAKAAMAAMAEPRDRLRAAVQSDSMPREMAVCSFWAIPRKESPILV